MLDPAVHSRQFVLGPLAIKAKADWLTIRLETGLILSHCPKLKIASVVDQRGRGWLLLGLAVQLDPNRPSPEEDLRNLSEEEVSSAYHGWAGRWLLIGGGAIHPDAGGLLGCYYRLASDAAGAQRAWMSSSLALLANLPGVEVPPGEPRRLLYGSDLEWDPPPRTGYLGIRKVLPTQTLDTASGTVRFRPIRFRSARALSYDKVLENLGSCLVTAMKNVDRPVWLALSAGYDSRLLLAAAVSAGIPFRTYTQTFPTMTAADRTVPHLLSKLAGVEHSYIHPRELDQGLLESFDAHCGGQNVDADRTFFPRGQWSWIKSEDVAVRGLAFEIGMCFYHARLPPDRPTADTLLEYFGVQHAEPYVRESIAEYIDWMSTTPIEGMDWRDRFYLEVRLAGWASTAEQSLDLVNCSRFFPANSSRIFELLLAIPEEKRRTRQHQVDLIERLSPELLRYPFNAPDGFVRVARNRLRKYGMLLREYGLATTVHQVNAAIRARRRRGQRVH